MSGLLTFIIIFGILVVVHEFGHFYFAKKSGILVREFAVGMGPKIFAHTGKDGTAYTIRLLPLGGYVRMAGWGDDDSEIKAGTPASLTLNSEGVVTRIDLSGKRLDKTSLPMTVVSYDLEDKLEISGTVLDEPKTYSVDHDVTIVEEDGTEVRIAPLDVQYQNASIWGRLITNFAGPMNNFILGILVFVLAVFIQGGVQNLETNQVRVIPDGAVAKAGLKNNERILQIGDQKVTDWESLSQAVDLETKDFDSTETLSLVVQGASGKRTLSVKPQKVQGRYTLGVTPSIESLGVLGNIQAGIRIAWERTFAILNALKNLILQPDLNKLGGPVAIYQMSNTAAQQGFLSSLLLMGMLSMNLGILNLIPIPALDGGKILINIIEAIRRKPLKQETETYITLAGVAIMVILMIAVTWNDIMRAFF
ncbi:RIP metalloprotease RseP [Streptococcus ferus]|uniref:Zinc metalloprotease n=1 Tax=Streptococcus ferus TaxID=1345 RepID=A0A2X3WAQ1_9STRE|nr:RIP metalloprotease RseP [Streptococcus ferus]SQF40973.1 Intramembrane protease RasP/YluC, implicated in cell division based on FtsL cleavage [Streptococcus ferus]